MKVRNVFMLALVAGSVIAQGAIANGIDNPFANNDFLTYHPDIANRNAGLDAYRHGKFEKAATYFRRAARYSDKASEAMLAEMYWKGEGVAADRSSAYAWMDLAAERGYPSLLARREYYWQQLSAAEQANAIAIGQTVYVEYGDSVTLPRLAAELRRGMMDATGSHTGYIGTIDVYAALPPPGNKKTGMGTVTTFEAETTHTEVNGYFAKKYWKAQDYAAWIDASWNAPKQRGHVNVGALQQVRNDKTPLPGQAPSDHAPQLE